MLSLSDKNTLTSLYCMWKFCADFHPEFLFLLLRLLVLMLSFIFDFYIRP